MHRMITFCLFLLMVSTVYAKQFELTVQMSEKWHQGKLHWEVRGITNLPAKTILALKIAFGDAEVRGSRTRIRTREGKFVYYFPLHAREVLPGEYQVIVSYLQAMQVASYQRQHQFGNTRKVFPVYVGKRHQEQRKRREYREFLSQTLNKLTTLLSFWETRTTELLQQANPQSKQRQVQSFVEEQIESFQRMEQAYQQKRYPQVLAPYYLWSMNDLNTILQLSQRYLKYHLQQLIEKYHLRPHFAPREIPSSVRGYRENILQIIQQIKQRGETLDTYDLEDLQQEIFWFNEIYQEVTEAYRQHRREFQHQKWQSSLENWLLQIAEFKNQLSFHQNSSLANSYPDLVSHLASLSKQLELLALHYTRELYLQARVPLTKRLQGLSHTQEQIMRELQERFLQVYQVMEKEQEHQQQARQQLIATLENAVARVVSLEELIQAKKKSLQQPQPQKFQKEWQQKFASFQELLGNFSAQLAQESGIRRKLVNIDIFLNKLSKELFAPQENMDYSGHLDKVISYYQRKLRRERNWLEEQLKE